MTECGMCSRPVIPWSEQLMVGSGVVPHGNLSEAAKESPVSSSTSARRKRCFWWGCAVDACSLEKLALLLNKKLDLDARLAIYNHLDRCYHCRGVVYRLAQERDKHFFIYPPVSLGNKSVA